MYVSGPPPLASTPLLCVRNIPCDLYMWWRREDAAILPPHSAQLNLVIFLYQKVAHSPAALLLYADVPCFSQMNPGVYTIALFFPRFFWISTLSNILTMAVRVVFTHVGLYES